MHISIKSAPYVLYVGTFPFSEGGLISTWVWHNRCVKWAAPYRWLKFACYQNLAVAVKCIPREVIRLLRIRPKVCKPRFQDNSYLNVMDHVQCLGITNIGSVDAKSWSGQVKVKYQLQKSRNISSLPRDFLSVVSNDLYLPSDDPMNMNFCVYF